MWGLSSRTRSRSRRQGRSPATSPFDFRSIASKTRSARSTPVCPARFSACRMGTTDEDEATANGGLVDVAANPRVYRPEGAGGGLKASHDTFGFQFAKVPAGLFFHAHTCSV